MSAGSGWSSCRIPCSLLPRIAVWRKAGVTRFDFPPIQSGVCGSCRSVRTAHFAVRFLA